MQALSDDEIAAKIIDIVESLNPTPGTWPDRQVAYDALKKATLRVADAMSREIMRSNATTDEKIAAIYDSGERVLQIANYIVLPE